MVAARADLAGRQVGMMTVIRRDGHIGQFTAWLCECQCGTVKRIRTMDLARTDGKGAKSCGCTRHPRGPEHPNWSGHGEISGKRWKALVANARARGLDLGITIEEAWAIFLAQERRCALTGWQLVMGETASIDRIDSGRGYVSGNVQWLHKDVNAMKSDWPEERFVAVCRAVASQ